MNKINQTCGFGKKKKKYSFGADNSSFYTGVDSNFLTPKVRNALDLIYGPGGDGDGITSKNLEYRFGKRNAYRFGKRNAYRFGKKNGKWIQDVVKKMKRKGTTGSFTRYCKRKGYSSVTQSCINQGRKSPNALIRKRAVFAQNIRRVKKSSFGRSLKKKPKTLKIKLSDIKKDIVYLKK